MQSNASCNASPLIAPVRVHPSIHPSHPQVHSQVHRVHASTSREQPRGRSMARCVVVLRLLRSTSCACIWACARVCSCASVCVCSSACACRRVFLACHLRGRVTPCLRMGGSVRELPRVFYSAFARVHPPARTANLTLCEWWVRSERREKREWGANRSLTRSPFHNTRVRFGRPGLASSSRR